MFNSKRTLFLPNATADSAHLALIQLTAALIILRYMCSDLADHAVARKIVDGCGMRCSADISEHDSVYCKAEIAFCNTFGVLDGKNILEITVKDWNFTVEPNTYRDNMVRLLRIYDDARVAYHTIRNNPINANGIAFSPKLNTEQYNVLAHSRVIAKFNGLPLFDGTVTEPTFGNGCLALESFLKELKLSSLDKNTLVKSTDPIIDFLNKLNWR